MADRINDKEESIARVYQFLNTKKNWQKEADINGNGTIIKTEFRAYLLNPDSSFEFNSGEDKEDLIDAFWKSIDVNTIGKISGKGVSNKKALDEQEMANLEKNVEATSKIDYFIRTSFQCPSGLDNYAKQIRSSVKTGMINQAIEFLKNNDISALTDSKIQEFYQSSMNKATADYQAIYLIDKEVKEKYGDDIDYKSGSDSVRKDIVDDYISQLNGTESTEDISRDINAIVNAYLDTAETNSPASTNLLVQYGYDPMGDLNPLQLAVLTKDLTEKIIKHLESTGSEIVTGSFKEQAEEMVIAYIEDYLKSKTADEFNKLKTLDATSSEFENIEVGLKEAYTALQKAKQTLKDYVDNILAENNTAKTRAVNDTIGSSEKTRAHDIIDSMKSVNDIDNVTAELQKLIDEINKQLPEDFLSAITDITVPASQKKTINLPNNYGAYTTGHIHYSVSGDRAITISDSGVATIGSDTPGVYNCTVKVTDDAGTVLLTKQVKITVEMDSASVVNKVTGWNDKTSEHLEGVLPQEGDSCTITQKLTDTSFSDLYNNDYIVRLHISMDDSESWESAQSIVNSRLDQLGDLIYSSLITAELDTDILKAAVDSVIGGYKFTAASQMDANLNDDDDGTDSYDLTNNLAWRMKNDRTGTGHKVVGTRDDDASDSWVWGVRFKDIVDDIINKYKALGGK